MLCFGKRENGLIREREVAGPGIVVKKAEWMESGDDPVLSPTISLIEQPANSNFFAHFHRQNQFQLFVGGSGSLGPAPIEPVSIHYAGAYTGYGPLLAGPSGLKYLTIRPVCESGAIPVTEAKTNMVRGPKRHAQAGPVVTLSVAELARLEAPRISNDIEPGADGMGARSVCLPPGARHEVQVPRGATGTFVVVLAGSLCRTHNDEKLDRWESAFATADEVFPDFIAGTQGAQVMQLFVPAKHEAYMPGAVTGDGAQTASSVL